MWALREAPETTAVTTCLCPKWDNVMINPFSFRKTPACSEEYYQECSECPRSEDVSLGALVSRSK